MDSRERSSSQKYSFCNKWFSVDSILDKFVWPSAFESQKDEGTREISLLFLTLDVSYPSISLSGNNKRFLDRVPLYLLSTRAIPSISFYLDEFWIINFHFDSNSFIFSRNEIFRCQVNKQVLGLSH